MSTTSKSPRRVAAVALRVRQRAFPDYTTRQKSAARLLADEDDAKVKRLISHTLCIYQGDFDDPENALRLTSSTPPAATPGRSSSTSQPTAAATSSSF